MSLKKRFKILPARIGYKNYSFPHIGALREIIHEQIQKNIFEFLEEIVLNKNYTQEIKKLKKLSESKIIIGDSHKKL